MRVPGHPGATAAAASGARRRSHPARATTWSLVPSTAPGSDLLHALTTAPPWGLWDQSPPTESPTLTIANGTPMRGPSTKLVLLLLIRALAGAAFVRLRQPVLIAHTVAGVAMGSAGFRLVSTHDQIDLLARVGVAVLLFVVGLKLDLHPIRHIGPVALAAMGEWAGFSRGPTPSSPACRSPPRPNARP
jgi:hypothetical protein